MKPVVLPGIRIITISGRIGAGSTSLAKNLAEKLGWQHLEGGEIFWEAVRKKMQLAPKDTKLRPDVEDLLFEEKQTALLKEGKHLILESKLAGFCAYKMDDVFRIAVVCEDEDGQDQPQVRTKRLFDREKVSLADAKVEVLEREKNDLTKWRALYAHGDSQWIYWDKKYYNITVNTYALNQDKSLKFVLDAIGYNNL
ncbi:MAG TPA: hypothetical protein VF810_02320 [Patescibacteria group bacterium]